MPTPYRTIPEVLADAASRDPDGAWLRTDEGSMTFSAAASQVWSTARALHGAGVHRGDLVLVTARTTAPYLLCWLALASIGAVTISANPRSAPAELAGLAHQTRPKAIITDGGLASLIADADIAGIPVLGMLDAGDLTAGWANPRLSPAATRRPAAGGSRPDADARQPGTSGLPPGTDASQLSVGGPPPDAAVAEGSRWHLGEDVGPSDLAVLIPTSGTTGRSKLVMQTHRAYVLAGEGFPYWLELTAADRLMTSLPLFHINAPAYSVMGSLACGAGLILLPRFSAGTFLDSAREHGATEFNAIGAMVEILMRQRPRPGDADTSLRQCYTGPAPTRERQEEIERRFGIRIVVGYAMSESPYGLVWQHGTRPFGTLGAPRQHPQLGVINEVRVVGDDGTDLPPGETGELLLRNPVITPGYWGMPEETAAAITDGGWLRTGDLVTRNPDGTYTFVARKKEVLRRRGENLSPAEVEEALASHPSVLECAVVGVPSELSEDEVKAFVVSAPGARLDFAELRAHVAGLLASYKVPRFWQAIGELPHTPTARVAKHRLPQGRQLGEYDAEAGNSPAAS